MQSSYCTLPFSTYIVLIYILLTATSSAADERAKFILKDTLGIIRSSDLVEEGNGTQFNLGSSIKLTRKVTDYARNFRKKDFQIRFFRLSPDSPEPDYWEFFDPCYIYLSRVVSPGYGTEGAINVGQLDDPGWLDAKRGDPIERGRYLLVFEQLADKPPTKNKNEVFRLNKDQKDLYFESGLYIEILPVVRYDPTRIDQLADNMTKSRTTWQTEIRMNSSTLPCYRYKPINAPSNMTQFELTSLILCEIAYR